MAQSKHSVPADLKIESFDFEPILLKKEDPTWKFALGASPATDGMIVRLSAGGFAGHGYVSATAHMGLTIDALAAQLKHLRSFVVGARPDAITGLMTTLDRGLRGAPQAKAAIDCALHDLLSCLLGVPLTTLLGGAVRDRIPILRILAIKSPDEMAEQAKRLVGVGYRYLKIKVDGDVDLDVARVAAIRTAVGRDVHLTIDANQSYTPKDAVTAIEAMEPHDIDLVEQPVRASDLDGLSLVTNMVSVVIEADEAAGTLAEIYELARNRRVDAVSLKIAKLGGIRNTLAAAQICEAAGLKYRLGAVVGSRLASAFALHLACAMPGVDYACELAEYERLIGDPFEGLPVENGFLLLPAGVGAGVVRRVAHSNPDQN